MNLRRVGKASFVVCVALLVSISFGRVLFASSLAALVPDDAGLVFEVHRLAQHVGEFRQGDLYARLAEFPSLVAAVRRRIRPLERLTTNIEQTIGAGSQTLWTKVVGQEVLFAVWPAEEAGGEGPGLFLVRSSDAKTLRQVFDFLVDAQSRAGKLATEPVWAEVAGRRIQVAIIRPTATGQAVYVAVEGDLGVTSTRLQLVEHALRREQAAQADASSLAELPAYKAGQERLDPQSLVRVFLNPRPWDKHLSATPIPLAARESLVPEGLLATWKASQYLVASLTVGRELRGEAYLQCDRAALGEPWRTIAESVGGESKLAPKIPHDTLVAVTGRLDVQRLIRTLLELNRSGKLGTGRIPPAWGPALAVLSGLGPDVGVFLLSPQPAATSSAGWPLEWLIAAESRPLEAGSQQASLAQQLAPLVRTSLDFAAQLYDAQRPARPVQIESEPGGTGREPLTIVHGLPWLKAEEPIAFTVSEQTLWAGSAASVARNAARAAENVAPPPTRLSNPGALVYFNLAAIRQTLATNPSTAAALGKWLHVEPEQASHKLADLLAVLKLADTLVVMGRADADGFSCALRLARQGE